MMRSDDAGTRTCPKCTRKLTPIELGPDCADCWFEMRTRAERTILPGPYVPRASSTIPAAEWLPEPSTDVDLTPCCEVAS